MLWIQKICGSDRQNFDSTIRLPLIIECQRRVDISNIMNYMQEILFYVSIKTVRSKVVKHSIYTAGAAAEGLEPYISGSLII